MNSKKQIYLASSRGFCAGVKRAISLVDETLKNSTNTVYIFNELVHNKYVVQEMENKGAIFTKNINSISENSTIIFSAHGVSKKIEEFAKIKNLNIIDATCPLVKKEHKKAIQLEKNNYKLIIIGDPKHPEIIGTIGQTKNKHFIVENLNDIKMLPNLENHKVAFLMQTTLDVNETKELIKELQKKYPLIKGSANVCYATKERQEAIAQLANICDVIFIIGSKNSSNSNKLRNKSINLGCQAFLIDSKNEITENMYMNAKKIGLTAGASAPENILLDTLQFFESLEYYINPVIL